MPAERPDRLVERATSIPQRPVSWGDTARSTIEVKIFYIIQKNFIILI